MIKILIVDDSKTEAQILKTLFESHHDLKVIGCAQNGKEAVEMTALLKPDLITMDLEMPVMDGHTATRLIMTEHPTPIVVISSKLNNTLKDMTFLALEAGAVSVISKPIDITSKNFEKEKKYLIDTVRSMSEIKVIKRRFYISSRKEDTLNLSKLPIKTGNFELIAIGTSIGGPQALNSILSKLPEDLPVPIVIVQHMTKGFIDGLTKWLNNHTTIKIKNSEHNERLQKGNVYFAPDNFHLIVERDNHGFLISKLIKGDLVSGFCPSISVLLQSVATTCGEKAIGVLLTGMGNDGAQGLLDLKKTGGHTIIQDEKSCIVFGMAGVAKTLGAVDKIVNLNQIADYLINLTVQKK